MKPSPRRQRNRRAPASRTAPPVLAAALVLALFCAACGQRGPLYLPEPGAPAGDTQSPVEADENGDPEQADASPA